MDYNNFHAEYSVRDRKKDLSNRLGSVTDMEAIDDATKASSIRFSFSDWVYSTSLIGPFLISTASNKVSKLFWIFLFIAGVGLTIYNGVENVVRYTSWPRETKLFLNYKHLAFPVVTVCSVNPIRRTALSLFSDDIKDFFKTLDPTPLKKKNIIKLPDIITKVPDISIKVPDIKIKPKTPFGVVKTKTISTSETAKASTKINTAKTTQQAKESTKKNTAKTTQQAKESTKKSTVKTQQTTIRSTRNTTLITNKPNNKNTLPTVPKITLPTVPKIKKPKLPGKRKKRFIDKEAFLKYRKRIFMTDKRKEHERVLGGDEDTRNRVLDTFQYLYSLEDKDVRVKGGHKLKDMMLSCSFESRSCNRSHFKHVLSKSLGNCFSFNIDGSYLSRRSGNQYGLSLILYLELDEYIMGLTSGYGFRVSVNHQNLRPFPDTDGVFVSAGSETDIGIQMVNISRIGYPHGICQTNEEFNKIYGTDYSRQFCQSACNHKHILSSCKCYDRGSIRLYPNNVSATHAACTEDDINCLIGVNRDILLGNLSCSCPNPCQEISYNTQISSRIWPTKNFLDLLVDKVCRMGTKKRDIKACNNLIQLDEFSKMRNFLKVNIFYRDLNFNYVEEQEAYPWFTFLSDMGGALGLYLGLSVIGVFEIFQLLFIVIRNSCCKPKSHKSNKKSHTFNNSIKSTPEPPNAVYMSAF